MYRPRVASPLVVGASRPLNRLRFRVSFFFEFIYVARDPYGYGAGRGRANIRNKLGDGVIDFGRDRADGGDAGANQSAGRGCVAVRFATRTAVAGGCFAPIFEPIPIPLELKMQAPDEPPIWIALRNG